jgi:hypothetical protein
VEALRWSKRATSGVEHATWSSRELTPYNRQLKRVKREQDSANTFEAVACEWVALKTWEPITKKRRLDMLSRVAFPKIDMLAVKQIKPAHSRRVTDVRQEGWAERRGGDQAHHVQRV